MTRLPLTRNDIRRLRETVMSGLRRLGSAWFSSDTRARRHHKSWEFACDSLEVRALLTVVYHGGDLLEQVEVQGVYLGSDWNTLPVLQGQKANLEQFLTEVVSGPYMDMLTNAGYNVGRGIAAPGTVDAVGLPTNSSVSDTTIRKRLQTLITTGQVEAPDANQLYVVFVEPGVVVKNGGGASNRTFLGYHGAYAGKTPTGAKADIRYAVIPYPGVPNFLPGPQGFANALDMITSVASHEIAEAATDPDVNYKKLGWYDFQNRGEVADIIVTNTRVGQFLMQDCVNQNVQVIRPVNQAPGPAAPPRLGTVQNLIATPLNTTSMQLDWTLVSGATNYRVYLAVGRRVTQYGTYVGTTDSLSVQGLRAGKPVSFLVEAIRGESFTDSAWVTATPA